MYRGLLGTSFSIYSARHETFTMIMKPVAADLAGQGVHLLLCAAVLAICLCHELWAHILQSQCRHHCLNEAIPKFTMIMLTVKAAACKL